jgi:large subunit ribosomal protein L35
MPKMKTKSSAKKRFLITATGKVLHGSVGRKHKLRKRSSDMKRSTRELSKMDKSDTPFVKKHFLPYGAK